MNKIFLDNDYLIILVGFALAIVISIALFSLSFFFASRNLDKEKMSAYECGFSPFQDSRQKFDVRFYLVAILFLVFDLEVTYLFPWSIVLDRVGFFGFFSMYGFLIILTIGFLYEWLNGALDWE